MGWLQHDLTQQIVNVHWGGNQIFVVATISGNVYRVKPDAAKKLQVVSLPVLDIISLVGCDYGKPPSVEPESRFVIAGSALNPGGIGGSFGFICTSNDGEAWTQSFRTPEGEEPSGGTPVPWGGTVSAIVFSPDSKTFAATCLVLKYGQEVVFEEIYESDNGEQWGLSSSAHVLTMDQVITHDSFFPGSFCSHNADCKDDFIHSVPGGIMQSGDKIGMCPTNPPTVYYWNNSIPGNIDYHTLPLRVFGGFDEAIGSQPSQSVTIRRTDGEDIAIIDVAIPGLSIVTCVAGKGNTWLAGGFTGTSEDSAGGVVITRDGGDTWEPFGFTSSGVVGITAGEV